MRPRASEPNFALLPSVTSSCVSVGAAEAKWNADIRRAFTRKVLFIVFCQLLITTGISLLFYLVDPIRVRPRYHLPFLFRRHGIGLSNVQVKFAQ